MKIGIVSDSHGQGDRLARALKLLLAQGADAFVHCGDLGGHECLHVLGNSGRPAYAVCGNVDKHIPHLMTAAADAGVELNWEVVEVPLGDGQFLVATHGHDDQIVGELLAGQQFPYLCHGHTHRKRDEIVGKMRVINPGALQPHPCSVALLDHAKDALEFFEVD